VARYSGRCVFSAVRHFSLSWRVWWWWWLRRGEEFLKFQAEQEQFAAQHVELYMRYLKRDSRSGDKEKANFAELQTKLELELDSIAKEHGDTYIEGIQPVFDPLKARHFDLSWNWVRQDALVVYYDLVT